MLPKNPAQNTRWNLSDLYLSPEDPRIFSDLDNAMREATVFEQSYKPKFASNAVDSLSLSTLLSDYKKIILLMTKPSVYSHLFFAEQTTEPRRGSFLQKIQTHLTEIQNHLVFFEVEWNQLSQRTVDSLLLDPAIAEYRHFLETMRLFAPHTLTEPEERILSVKADTSGRAFARLFDETVNRMRFAIIENGETLFKSEPEVLSLIHSPDRKSRQAASESLAEGLDKQTHLITYIFNMILADHRANLKLRHYDHPMTPRNIANETELGSILHLIESVRTAYPMAQRYYHLKRRALKLEKLYDYDRYAPMQSSVTSVAYDDCRKIVIQSYQAFSPEAGQIAALFFEKNWIDAELREGKRAGAFACQTTPDLHPYVLVNYTGTLRDVMTVAHEIGHGIHQFLAARRVGILESSAPLTLAETASVFGEMLTFEKILKEETSPSHRFDLICGKIDDNFATVFRQVVLTDFELKVHQAGIQDGELSSEKISDFWMEANRALYGDSVELTAPYRHGWKYIPHFFHTPFYCYAYAFAQLFVLCLYERYQNAPASFVPRYLEMLSLGGSKRPAEIAAIAGLDFSKNDFWKDGLKRLELLITEAETLASQLKI